MVDAGKVVRDGLQLGGRGDVASPDAVRRAVIVGKEGRGRVLAAGIAGRTVPAHEEGVGTRLDSGGDGDRRTGRGGVGACDRRTTRVGIEDAEVAV